MISYIGFTLGIITLLQVYFKIAARYGIVDKPSHRSLHTKEIIRGAGIIFWFSGLYVFFKNNFEDYWFFLGFTIVSLISLIDDIVSLSVKVRLPFQFLGAGLLIHSLQLDGLGFLYVIGLLLLIVAMLNGFNFMDGINGITGLYALACFVSLWFVNNYRLNFIDNQSLVVLMICTVVFLFYNLRTTATCFGGDVGSIGIAFVLTYFVFKLIIQSGDAKYILFFAIYGIDTCYTFMYRLQNNEKIFSPHKLHLFQILVHKFHQSHQRVALGYCMVQGILNIWILVYNGPFYVCILPFGLILLCVHQTRKNSNNAITIK